MKRVNLDASSLFQAQRIETPHPLVDLRELHPAGLHWVVKAELLKIEANPGLAPEAALIRDRLRCRCCACGQHKERRGGKNLNHKFICAECLK